MLVVDDALSSGRWGPHVALCGADVCPPSVLEDEGSELSPEGVRYCEDCAREARRWVAEVVPVGEGGHRSWCSPAHCYHQDDGVGVHVRQPVRWTDDIGEVRFRSALPHPTDDDRTDLELTVTSLRPRDSVYVILSMVGARRLRDQLSAHDRDARGDEDSPGVQTHRGEESTR